MRPLIAIVLAFTLSTPAVCRDIKSKLHKKELTLLGITLNQSTMDNVVKKFGVAPRFKIGTGEEADDSLCYRSKSAPDVFVLFSTGVMGGGTDVVGFRISRRKAIAKYVHNCRISSAVPNPIPLPRGLTLDASVDDIKSAFGKPYKTNQNSLTFMWDEVRKNTKEEMAEQKRQFPNTEPEAEYDQGDWIEVNFLDGKLASIYYSRIDSL